MRARLLFAAGATFALAACQTAPSEPVVTQTETAEPAPVDVATPVTGNPSEGMTENEWGGEIPQSQPAGEVEDDGLGDLD